MIINIKTSEGEVVFETNEIDDDKKRNTAHAIIHKVANLEILNEALMYARNAHRSTLEGLLMGCEDAKIDPQDEEQKATV